MSVEWRPIPGYDGDYEVSSTGEIRSFKRSAKPRLLSLNANSITGYVVAYLYRGGEVTHTPVHQAVAAAFLGERPEGCDVCHNDGNRTNNHAENLRYDSRSANVLDSVKHGTHPQGGRTHCIRGHAFDEENTYQVPGGKGWRGCKECRRQQLRESRARRREVIA